MDVQLVNFWSNPIQYCHHSWVLLANTKSAEIAWDWARCHLQALTNMSFQGWSKKAAGNKHFFKELSLPSYYSLTAALIVARLIAEHQFYTVVFCRMETFSRSQLQQELKLRCYKLAANNNRGFKQEFGVTTSEEKRTLSVKRWRDSHVCCCHCLSAGAERRWQRSPCPSRNVGGQQRKKQIFLYFAMWVECLSCYI